MCCIDDKKKHQPKPQPTQMFEVDPGLIRFRLELTAPYFSQALWALKPKEIDDLKTFAVDKHWKWYYGKEFPSPIEEQTTALFRRRAAGEKLCQLLSDVRLCFAGSVEEHVA